MDLDSIILQLYKNGIFRLGQFRLKSGIISPFYIDLRLVPSYPDLFSDIVMLYCELIHNLQYTIGAVAGIMSAGIPFATGIALKEQLPLLQIRKTSKNYGTEKLIEGTYTGGEPVVLIDDLISTGVSKIPSINALKLEKHNIGDVVVFIDRTKNDVDLDFSLKSVIRLGDILSILLSHETELNSNDLMMLEDAIHEWEI